MCTYEVGIAVNGTVYMRVEADGPGAAEAAAEAQFLADFASNVAQVGRKSCTVETVDPMDEED